MRPVLNASCQIDMCTPRIHEQLVKKSEITFTIQVRRMVAAGRICNKFRLQRQATPAHRDACDFRPFQMFVLSFYNCNFLWPIKHDIFNQFWKFRTANMRKFGNIVLHNLSFAKF